MQSNQKITTSWEVHYYNSPLYRVAGLACFTEHFYGTRLTAVSCAQNRVKSGMYDSFDILPLD